MKELLKQVIYLKCIRAVDGITRNKIYETTIAGTKSSAKFGPLYEITDDNGEKKMYSTSFFKQSEKIKC